MRNYLESFKITKRVLNGLFAISSDCKFGDNIPF